MSAGFRALINAPMARWRCTALADTIASPRSRTATAPLRPTTIRQEPIRSTAGGSPTRSATGKWALPATGRGRFRRVLPGIPTSKPTTSIMAAAPSTRLPNIASRPSLSVPRPKTGIYPDSVMPYLNLSLADFPAGNFGSDEWRKNHDQDAQKEIGTCSDAGACLLLCSPSPGGACPERNGPSGFERRVRQRLFGGLSKLLKISAGIQAIGFYELGPSSSLVNRRFVVSAHATGRCPPDGFFARHRRYR